ncbi:MAG: glycoside hydrolase family 15 protein [Deltaproteobacteria bacterium]
MDLYSTAKHLAAPFVVDENTDVGRLPLAAHGIIGDGFSAALVRVDGVIDWLCWPRFDSPSLFASLLDSDRGGHTGITPAQRPFESLQRYDPETNVLETLFTVPGHGTARLTDLMPWTDDPRASIHEVHRRIECLEGEVEFDIVFDPRFDYARVAPLIEIGEHGVVAESPNGERVVAVAGRGTQWKHRSNGGVAARIKLRAGQRIWTIISWDAAEPEPPAAYRPFDLLRTTRLRWRQWSSQLNYDGPFRHSVVRSALTMKLLTYAPTGAMVAAPTTSLPEWIGGARNWDYRYAWIRDAALAVRSNNLVGCRSEARDFFHFIRDTIDGTGGLEVMYAIDGSRVPAEEELEHLRGFRGSGPVRIGNGARDQLQIDSAGALVDAAHLYEHFGGTLTVRAWRKLRHIVEGVRQVWREPDHGIWEPRDGTRQNTHSKLMSWLALDRGAGIARAFGDVPLQDAWLREAGAIHADICANALDSTGKHFVAVYGEDRADATLLLLAGHGFLPEDHPLIVSTVDFVQRELSTGPYLHRYRADDGVGGDEGAFVLCGFWLAETLALQGKLDEALEVFTAHIDASNHLGLLAEEIDPSNGALLGNFPQAFSHLGLINTAMRLDRALRSRDEGLHSVPHLIGGVSREVG